MQKPKNEPTLQEEIMGKLQPKPNGRIKTSMYLSEENFEKLRAHCKKHKLVISQVIDQLIVKFLSGK